VTLGEAAGRRGCKTKKKTLMTNAEIRTNSVLRFERIDLAPKSIRLKFHHQIHSRRVNFPLGKTACPEEVPPQTVRSSSSPSMRLGLEFVVQHGQRIDRRRVASQNELTQRNRKRAG
jgi:hypothetical protein